ncbi:hypothetical protein [Micromonospora arborensis]|uniref:hypothetical protein n=1 Tax=Micromonospora arborensis TaxID=2116518 RepID=UPI003711DFFA
MRPHALTLDDVGLWDDLVQPHQAPQVLAALKCATQLMTTHGLYAYNVSITPARPGSRRFDLESDQYQPALPEIHVTLLNTPGELLRWCDVLQAPIVRAYKTRTETRFEVRVRRVGYEWSLSSSMRRPEGGPYLPGIEATWNPHPGTPPLACISRTELRTTLATLGVRRREPGTDRMAPIQPEA